MEEIKESRRANGPIFYYFKARVDHIPLSKCCTLLMWLKFKSDNDFILN